MHLKELIKFIRKVRKTERRYKMLLAQDDTLLREIDNMLINPYLRDLKGEVGSIKRDVEDCVNRIYQILDAFNAKDYQRAVILNDCLQESHRQYITKWETLSPKLKKRVSEMEQMSEAS